MISPLVQINEKRSKFSITVIWFVVQIAQLLTKDNVAIAKIKV